MDSTVQINMSMRIGFKSTTMQMTRKLDHIYRCVNYKFHKSVKDINKVCINAREREIGLGLGASSQALRNW